LPADCNFLIEQVRPDVLLLVDGNFRKQGKGSKKSQPVITAALGGDYRLIAGRACKTRRTRDCMLAMGCGCTARATMMTGSLQTVINDGADHYRLLSNSDCEKTHGYDYRLLI
jgi:hypothetical protein